MQSRFYRSIRSSGCASALRRPRSMSFFFFFNDTATTEIYTFPYTTLFRSEGSYTERFPNIERSRNGMLRLFRQFSWPYGIPSHVAPETPGSIHEGGELGYSLVHAYGAAFDNPDLIVTCIIGDGEAETGALAASWHSNKFLNPARDGAVLPILHLNGFKIANPTVLARISHQELTDLIRGYGYEPHFVEGDVPAVVHQGLAATLDTVLAEIHEIQSVARSSPNTVERPRWPMDVFRTKRL